jgi:hypothetical protein
LPGVIAEFTEKLPGLKPPTWQAFPNLKARCDESVAGLPENSKPIIIDEKKFINRNASSCYSPNKQLSEL